MATTIPATVKSASELPEAPNGRRWYVLNGESKVPKAFIGIPLMFERFASMDDALARIVGEEGEAEAVATYQGSFDVKLQAALRDEAKRLWDGGIRDPREAGDKLQDFALTWAVGQRAERAVMTAAEREKAAKYAAMEARAKADPAVRAQLESLGWEFAD